MQMESYPQSVIQVAYRLSWAEGNARARQYKFIKLTVC